VSGFIEVFKYAVKFSDQPIEDTWHCYETLKGKRLLGSAGCFRGVEVPEQLTDDELHDLPFHTLFYRYLRGGYSLENDCGAPAPAKHPAPVLTPTVAPSRRDCPAVRHGVTTPPGSASSRRSFTPGLSRPSISTG
jgi:hypothetical protein